MRGRLSFAILISLTVHALLFQQKNLLRFPSIELTNYPVSIELSLSHSRKASGKNPGKASSEKSVPVQAAAQGRINEEKMTQKNPLKAPQPKEKNRDVSSSPRERSEMQGVREASPLEGQPPPVYPVIARYRQLEGMVILWVEVLASGMCGKIKVKESSGVDILDQAAIKGVKKWKFRPATENGKQVPSLIEIPVKFQLRS